MYKQPPKGPQHDVDGNMGPRMFPGTLLGYSHLSNDYRVATAEGDVIKVRSLLRRPLGDRWDGERLRSIVTTPWCLRASSAPGRLELGPAVDAHKKGEEEKLPMPRRLKITLKTLEQYGTTDGCPQCAHVRAFREAKPGIPHTEACRKRIVDAMGQNAAGAERLSRQELRVDRALSERVKAADGQRCGDRVAELCREWAEERGSSNPLPGPQGPGAEEAASTTSPSKEFAAGHPELQDGDDSMDEGDGDANVMTVAELCPE